MERSHEWKDSVWQFKVSRVELSNLLKTRKRKFVCTVMYVLFYIHMYVLLYYSIVILNVDRLTLRWCT